MTGDSGTDGYLDTILNTIRHTVKVVMEGTSINFGGTGKNIPDIVDTLKNITSDEALEGLCGVLADGKRDKEKKEMCKKVFVKLVAEPPSSANNSNNLLEKIYNAIKNGGDGGGGGGGPSGDCGKYVTLLEALKKLASTKEKDIESFCKKKHGNKREQENCEKTLRRVLKLPLIDTCYGGKRAEALKNGLGELRKLDSGCVLVRLLLASYIGMLVGKDEVFERVEWIPLLLRAAARAQRSSNDVYIPVCPGRGDVAAVAYYLALCCGSPAHGGSSGS